jgi:hypothetical protein
MPKHRLSFFFSNRENQGGNELSQWKIMTNLIFVGYQSHPKSKRKSRIVQKGISKDEYFKLYITDQRVNVQYVKIRVIYQGVLTTKTIRKEGISIIYYIFENHVYSH